VVRSRFLGNSYGVTSELSYMLMTGKTGCRTAGVRPEAGVENVRFVHQSARFSVNKEGVEG